MDVTDDFRCLICGKENDIGLKADIQTDFSNRTSCIEVAIPERFQGWQGIAHGGMVTALLDEAAVYACMGISKRLVTAEIKVKFIKTTATAESAIVKGWVVDQRRNIIFAKSTIEQNGQITAEAESKIFMIE